MLLQDIYLCEAAQNTEDEYKAAVACIQYRDKWLLGLAKGTHDDRNNKWCMVGGGIKGSETPERAATREAKEEANVSVRAVGKAFKMPGKKFVAFVHCRMDTKPRCLTPNHEFASIGLFTKKEMDSLELYKNVKPLISKCR